MKTDKRGGCSLLVVSDLGETSNEIVAFVTDLSYRMFDLYYLCVFGLMALSQGLVLLVDSGRISRSDQEHIF